MSTAQQTTQRDLNFTRFTTLSYARGVATGLAGAGTLAVFFFFADLAQGVPLRTPAAMGSIIFRGEMLPVAAPPEPVLVLGYTLLHGAGFAALGILAALLLQSIFRDVQSRTVLVVGASAALFIAFQAYIVGLAEMFAPGLMLQLGVAEVSLANALAAMVMASLLVSDLMARR